MRLYNEQIRGGFLSLENKTFLHFLLFKLLKQTDRQRCWIFNILAPGNLKSPFDIQYSLQTIVLCL